MRTASQSAGMLRRSSAGILPADCSVSGLPGQGVVAVATASWLRFCVRAVVSARPARGGDWCGGSAERAFSTVRQPLRCSPGSTAGFQSMRAFASPRLTALCRARATVPSWFAMPCPGTSGATGPGSGTASRPRRAVMRSRLTSGPLIFDCRCSWQTRRLRKCR